jgi:hypothetical protein
MSFKTYWMFLAGAVSLIMGFFGTFFGLDQLRLAMHASDKPQPVRLADLGARPPGDNVYVALTDFTPVWEGTLTQAETQDGPWSQVWVPLAPAAGRQQPRPQDVRAVIMFNRIHNEAELEEALDGRPLVGLIKSRGGYAQWQDLRERNPGVALNQCWVVWEDHEPLSVTTAVGIVGVAIPLFALGLCLVIAGSQVTSPADQGAHHVAFMMSPLVLLIAGLARLLRDRRWLSGPAAAVVLAATGIPLFVLGGLVIWQGGFSPLDEMMGRMIGGSFLLDVGFALLVCGCVCGLKAARQPAGMVDEPPTTVDVAAQTDQPQPGRRAAAGYLLGAGAGVLLAGFAWLNQDPAAASTAAILIGAGVTACVLGIFFLWGSQQAGVVDMPDSEQVRN